MPQIQEVELRHLLSVNKDLDRLTQIIVSDWVRIDLGCSYTITPLANKGGQMLYYRLNLFYMKKVM